MRLVSGYIISDCGLHTDKYLVSEDQIDFYPCLITLYSTEYTAYFGTNTVHGLLAATNWLICLCFKLVFPIGDAFQSMSKHMDIGVQPP